MRLLVEELEDRMALAGNVVAVQAGAELLLTGDDVNNRLWITGNGPGNFAVQAIDTDLNGVYAATLPFSGVSNVVLKMGGGNDTVSLIRSELPGSLTYFGGDGDDGLFFGSANHENQRVGRVFAFLGKGNDTVSAFRENSLSIAQSFVVHGGDGSQSLSLETDTFLGLGHVAIKGGPGDDIIGFSRGLTTAGSVIVNSGEGRNGLQFLGDTLVQGSIVLTGGTDQDDLSMGLFAQQTSHLARGIFARLGDGDNNVSFHGSTNVAGPIRVLTGVGSDEFRVNNNFLAPQSNRFTAPDIDLRLGDGDSFVSLEQSSTELQRLSIRAGSGKDFFRSLWLIANESVSLAMGEGDNHFSFSNSTVYGPFSWKSGGGVDNLFVESGFGSDDRQTTFHAPAQFDLGAGDDHLYLATSEPDTLSFISTVVLDGGLGNDELLESLTVVYTVAPAIVGFE